MAPTRARPRPALPAGTAFPALHRPHCQRRAAVAIGRWAGGGLDAPRPSGPRPFDHAEPRYPSGATLVASITALMSPWARQVAP